MREQGSIRMALSDRRASGAGLEGRGVARLSLHLVCAVVAVMLMSGCSHFDEARQAKAALAEANDLFHQGRYTDSLDRYGRIIGTYPASADRVLFEMGVVYAHPKNQQKDYQKALESFQRLIREYPESAYRQNSEMMLFNITNVALKDATIAAQQAQIASLRQELGGREKEVASLQERIGTLEQKLFAYALQYVRADRILIEKKARRLTLLSKGEVLKAYSIALGGNPVGPKERQGDNRTPEGSYTIDSRNKSNRYHLSLHISYPNDKDRKRAKELGVSPGGDIMIHGIKNGYSWVGDAHADVDWTKGCIAVTDEEIDEINKLAPNGTIVEIRP